MILIVNYHLFLFHYFAEDPLAAYNVGWSCIGIMTLLMLVNAIVVTVMIIKGVIRFMRILCRKCSKVQKVPVKIKI